MQPARRRPLKRLSGLVAGCILAGPLQAVPSRSPMAAAPLSSGKDPIPGEIILAEFNFAPQGYALCNGSPLSISQNTALFSLLRATYSGNATPTFGLPGLRGRMPLHNGNSREPKLSILAGPANRGRKRMLTTAQMRVFVAHVVGRVGWRPFGAIAWKGSTPVLPARASR